MDGRLIVDGVATGDWNMSVDQVLLESAGQDGSCFLRFYHWSPATLSLGYFQASSDRLAHPASMSLPVVRRQTGGGALIHDELHELTYSLAMADSNRFSRDETLHLAGMMHRTLIDTLSGWGIAAAEIRNPRPEPDDPPFLCFLRRAEQDVVLGDHKIAGSAQRRTRQAALVHGSVLLTTSPHAPELLGIGDISQGDFEVSDLQVDWAERVARELQVRWATVELSADQKDRAGQLRTTRYGSPSWLERR